jgi:hypothetical protein
MYGQWLAFEHERLHTVEHWPENGLKEATLAAIACTIAALRSNGSRCRVARLLSARV